MNHRIYKIKIDILNRIIWKKEMPMDLQGKIHKINLWQICGIWDHPIYLCNHVVASTCTLTVHNICFPFNTYWYIQSMPYKIPSWTVENIHVCIIINKKLIYTYIISHYVPFFKTVRLSWELFIGYIYRVHVLYW